MILHVVMRSWRVVRGGRVVNSRQFGPGLFQCSSSPPLFSSQEQERGHLRLTAVFERIPFPSHSENDTTRACNSDAAGLTSAHAE